MAVKVRVAHAPRARRYRSRARPSGTTSALCNGARGPRACPAVDSAARRARCTRPRPRALTPEDARGTGSGGAGAPAPVSSPR